MMPFVSLLGRLATFMSIALCCALSCNGEMAHHEGHSCLTVELQPNGLEQLRPFSSSNLSLATKGHLKPSPLRKEIVRSVRPPIRALRSKIEIPIIAIRFHPATTSLISELSSCPQEACYVNDSELRPSMGVRNWDAIIPVDSKAIAPTTPIGRPATRAIEWDAILIRDNVAELLKSTLPIQTIAADQAQEYFQQLLIHRHDKPLPFFCQWDLQSLIERGADESERLAIARQQQIDSYWEYYQDCDRWNVRFAELSPQLGIKPQIASEDDQRGGTQITATQQQVAALVGQVVTLTQTTIKLIDQELRGSWMGRLATELVNQVATETADLNGSSQSLHR